MEEARRVHQPILDVLARAAVRSVLMLWQASAARAGLSAVLTDMAGNMRGASEAVRRGQLVPSSGQLDFTGHVLELALADTRALRTNLEIVLGQVRDLHFSYEVARTASPPAAVRALRDVSRSLLSAASEEERQAWKYALLIWRRLGAEGPAIAGWQPGLVPGGVEKKFRFNESSGTWVCEDDDGSRAAVGAETGRDAAR